MRSNKTSERQNGNPGMLLLFLQVCARQAHRWLAIAARHLNMQASSCPQGRMKRYFYISVILAAIVVSAVTLLSLRSGSLQGIPSVPGRMHRLPPMPQIRSPSKSPQMQQILGFRKYLDSLRLHALPAYDSIRAARPGLLDSLQWLQAAQNISIQSLKNQQR